MFVRTRPIPLALIQGNIYIFPLVGPITGDTYASVQKLRDRNPASKPKPPIHQGVFVTLNLYI